MDPTTAGLVTIAFVVVFILIEMPVALAICLSGVLGIVLIGDLDLAYQTLGAVPYSSTAKYALFAIPAYILLGCLISHSGIGTLIYQFVARVMRWLPGGLAATAVLATALFSGISGSSSADVATFGRISVTEMVRKGYGKAYAAAVVAAAGTFAVLIPPSLAIIIYAITAQQSVGAMLLAGVVPGIVSALCLALFVVARAALSKDAQFGARDLVTVGGAPEPVLLGVGGTASRATVSSATSGDSTADPQVAPEVVTAAGQPEPRGGAVLAVVYAGILFMAVIGGLYSGVFTATEAGAVGAIVAALIAVAATAGTGISLRRVLWNSMTEAAETTSMIFLLVIGGGVFSFSLALSGLPTTIAEWAGGLDLAPHAVAAIILILLLPIGAFLDGLSVLLLTVPVIAPVASELGLDGVWFGILVLKVVEIGLITPPVGINVFIVSSITKAPVDRVYRAISAFVVLDICVTAGFFLFPDVVLWLPRAAGLL